MIFVFCWWLKVFDEFKPDFVLYDVLGDVVCGGFAVPIRDGLVVSYTSAADESLCVPVLNKILLPIVLLSELMIILSFEEDVQSISL